MARTSTPADFVKSLRAGALTAPTPALAAFAARASRLSPRELLTEAEQLLLTENAPALARLVTGVLQGHLGDLAEHGAQAEFATDKALLKKSLTAWSKRAGPAAPSDALLSLDLESELVSGLEYAKLPPAQHAAWMKLRNARTFVTAAGPLSKQKLEPWFAELVAAYVSRELQEIARTRHAESWQSKLSDVPKLLELLVRLGPPPLFGPRALKAANALVLRHGDDKTRAALRAMNALRATAEQKAEVAKAKRTADVMARAVAIQRAAMRQQRKAAPGRTGRGR